MNVIFFGASKYVLPIVDELNKNFNLEKVFTTEKEKNDPVISFCIKNTIPYFQIDSKRKLLEQKEKIKSDIGVVADFGVIIPKEILENFRHGILNIHPSFLPKFRGPTPVQTALLEEKKTTGITIIKLDEQMDHGPILFQEKENIDKNDTTQSLYENLFKKASLILTDLIPRYVKEEIEPIEQNHKDATFTKTLKKEDGFIDFSNLPNFDNFEAKVKAFYPWPSVWTKIEVDKNREKIVKFLPDKKVQVEGKNRMSYKDFLNGYPNANSKLRLFLEQNA